MKLSATKIRNTRPGKKAIKLYDGRGLYLLITPAGARYWRWKYRWQGKEKLLSLGVYPDVSLAKARDRCQEARTLLSDGVDPSETRHAEKVAASGAENFATIAYEWLEKQSKAWVPAHAKRQRARLEKHVFPWLGDHHLKEITAPELLSVLRRVESSGAVETAHRIRSICSQVFRYAIATGSAERDTAADLRGALAPSPDKHLPAITDRKRVGELLRAMWGYPGTFVVKCALQRWACIRSSGLGSSDRPIGPNLTSTGPSGASRPTG